VLEVSYAIGTVEERRVKPGRGDGPCVQFGARKAYQTADRVQPERMVLVFPSPMNGIAGQSVFAVPRCHAAILQPAEPALGGDPQGSIRAESQLIDAAAAEPAALSRERFANAAISEIRDASLLKPNPQATAHRINRESQRRIVMPQFGPCSRVDLAGLPQL